MRKRLLALFTAIAITILPCMAFAQEAAPVQEAAPAQEATVSGISDKALCAIAAAAAIGIAGAMGAIAQGKVGASAMDGIARNPGAAGKMFVPMLLGMAFIESLVLYAFLIALMIK